MNNEIATIIIDDNDCQIENEKDHNFLIQLDSELSYFIQGAKYSQAFKRRAWDGMRHLLSSSLNFPSGLLQRVKDFYNKNGKSFSIQDDRSVKSEIKSLDISSKLNFLKITPFDYQLQAVETVKINDRGILKMPTGSGKTLTAALITAYFGKPTIIYVISKDLLYQTHNFFKSLFKEEIGIVGDGLCLIHNINIVSVWTSAQALNKAIPNEDDEKNLSEDKYEDIKKMLLKTKVNIFDECHISSADSIQEIAKYTKAEHIYGMSGSPWRDDGSDLLIECILGKYIVDISASSLIDKGYLVPPIIKFIKVPKMQGLNKKHYQTVYKKYIVETDIRNGYIVKGAQSLVEQGYQTLVLYNSVAHGELLFEQLVSKIPCVLLSGKDSSEIRKTAKEQLEQGKIKCIIASKIFDIGVDLPSLSGLIIASSGKSSVRALQRIGRVIRKFTGKKQAAVIDFYDQAPFLKDHSIERKEIYSSEERFKVIWPN